MGCLHHCFAPLLLASYSPIARFLRSRLRLSSCGSGGAATVDKASRSEAGGSQAAESEQGLVEIAVETPAELPGGAPVLELGGVRLRRVDSAPL